MVRQLQLLERRLGRKVTNGQPTATDEVTKSFKIARVYLFIVYLTTLTGAQIT